MVKQPNTTLSLFLETGRLIRSRMEHTMPLPFAQSELLRLVSEKGSPAMHDIADYFKITAPSATSLVDELVRSSYLERIRGKQDRRQVRVTLTREGKAALKKVILCRKKILGEIIAVLSASDRNDFNRILTKILTGA